MDRLNFRWLLPAAVLALGLAAVAAVLLLAPPTPSAGPGIGGPFALTAQDGRIMTQADFAGAPFLVFFGYTHCPDVCPTTLFDVSQIFARLGKDRKIAAAFISVDPERDTPAVMKEFMASFDPRMVALSGPPEALQPVLKAYRVYAKKVAGKDGDYTMDHISLVYLMDKNGRFVSSFNTGQTPEAAAKELAGYF